MRFISFAFLLTVFCAMIMPGAPSKNEPSDEEYESSEVSILEQFQCHISVLEATAKDFSFKESWSKTKSKLEEQVENYKQCKNDVEPSKCETIKMVGFLGLEHRYLLELFENTNVGQAAVEGLQKCGIITALGNGS